MSPLDKLPRRLKMRRALQRVTAGRGVYLTDEELAAAWAELAALAAAERVYIDRLWRHMTPRAPLG